MTVTLHKDKASEVRYYTNAGEHPFTAGHPAVVNFDAATVMDFFLELVAPYYPEITTVRVREYNKRTGQTYTHYHYNL